MQGQKAAAAHHEHKGHEAAEDGEEDVATLIGEAAAGLEQDEGGHEERADSVQQRPVHRRQQPARRRLPRALQEGTGALSATQWEEASRKLGTR